MATSINCKHDSLVTRLSSKLVGSASGDLRHFDNETSDNNTLTKVYLYFGEIIILCR